MFFATVSNREESGKTWLAPSLCFPKPALYISFDNADEFPLMEGLNHVNLMPLVPGKVYYKQ